MTGSLFTLLLLTAAPDGGTSLPPGWKAFDDRAGHFIVSMPDNAKRSDDEAFGISLIGRDDDGIIYSIVSAPHELISSAEGIDEELRELSHGAYASSRCQGKLMPASTRKSSTPALADLLWLAECADGRVLLGRAIYAPAPGRVYLLLMLGPAAKPPRHASLFMKQLEIVK